MVCHVRLLFYAVELTDSLKHMILRKFLKYYFIGTRKAIKMYYLGLNLRLMTHHLTDFEVAINLHKLHSSSIKYKINNNINH